MVQENKAVNALIILDGCGINPEKESNAFALANTPFLDFLEKTYPTSELQCAGNAVGLPKGTMGNSEVGHMNIGAGRKVFQDLVRINNSIKDGTIFENSPLVSLMEKIKNKNKALHLMGLLSDGGVHSHISHLFILIDMAKKTGIEKLFIHPILDGRDTPPNSGIDYISQLNKYLKKLAYGKIATVCGRYWAMDRDTRWDRVEKAFRLFTRGIGTLENDPLQAVKKAYENDQTDEFVEPVLIDSNGIIKEDDGMIFFNFRADRAKEITTALTSSSFNEFQRDFILTSANYLCMTQYDESFNLPVAFGPEHLDNVLGEILSRHGLKQLRIAETEKYAHVTYFFNGGDEKIFQNEERILIPSPRDVPTYDEKPEMSAFKVAEAAKEKIASGDFNFIILNFANMDMVGHTGILGAAIKACEAVDLCLKTIVEQVWDTGGTALITADHGNCETMVSKEGNAHTAHTLNNVKFILAGEKFKDTQIRNGILGDIAPTILKILNIEQPFEMTGTSLI